MLARTDAKSGHDLTTGQGSRGRKNQLSTEARHVHGTETLFAVMPEEHWGSLLFLIQ